MKIPPFLLTTLPGIVLAAHLAMNGKVGAALTNAHVGNAMFRCIGAVTGPSVESEGSSEY